jgi:hypothetical protein
MTDSAKSGPRNDGATADDLIKQFLKKKMIEFKAFRCAQEERA